LKVTFQINKYLERNISQFQSTLKNSEIIQMNEKDLKKQNSLIILKMKEIFLNFITVLVNNYLHFFSLQESSSKDLSFDNFSAN